MYGLEYHIKKSIAAFIPNYDKVWNYYFGYVNPSNLKTGLDFIDEIYSGESY